MAQNEAKIRFTAETQEFTNNLKEAKEEVKTLNSELKLNAAEMRNAGESVELLENRQSLLTQKLEATIQQQEALSGKIEAATAIYGEDSQEVANLERQLTAAQTAQQNIEADISNVNARLEEQAESAAFNESALGQLTATISDQQSELQALQEEYINVALESGTESEEAQNLADRITDLSSSLSENQSRLEEVTGAAEQLGGGMGSAQGEVESTADGIQQMSSLAGSAGNEVVGMISNIASGIAAGGVAGGVMAIAEGLVEIGKAAVEAAQEYQETEAIIVQGTGLIGEELDTLKSSAEGAWQAVAAKDLDLTAYGTIAADLNTRFGWLDEGLVTAATEDMAKFVAITGTDASQAVNLFADAMARWGLSAQDMPTLMDQVTVANQSCDAGVSSLMNSLTTYSTTWNDLGYSTGDALAQLVAWEQAGLNSEQVIRGLDKACKGLADTNTADIPGAINAAMGAVAGAEDRYAGLQVQVGDTGKTINDLFGQRMAGAFVDAMQSGAVATDTYSTALANSKDALITTFNESRTAQDYYAQDHAKFVQGTKDLVDTVANGYTAAAQAYIEENNIVLEGTGQTQSSMAELSAEMGGLGEAANTAATNVSGAGTTIGTTFDNVAANAQTAESAVDTSMTNMQNDVATGAQQMEASSYGTQLNGVKDAATSAEATVANSTTNMTNATAGAVNTMEATSYGAQFNGITNGVANAEGAVESGMSEMEAAAQGGVSGLEDEAAKSQFAGIANGINAAKEYLSRSLAEMKGYMENMQWSLPRPKVPVFSISGEFDAKSKTVPTISVSWHAAGGIFNQPTLLTSGSGAFHGVGEAGAEAIAPIDTLREYMIDTVQSAVPRIDYDLLAKKLGHAVGHEFAKVDNTIEINNREFGRIVREVR